MKQLRFQDETVIITVFCTNLLHAHFWPIVLKVLHLISNERQCKGEKACEPEKLRHICSMMAHLSTLWAIRTKKWSLVLSVGLSSALRLCLWPFFRRRVCWWYWSPLLHPHLRAHSYQEDRCHQNHWVGMSKKQRLLEELELWHSTPAPGRKRNGGLNPWQIIDKRKTFHN